MKILNSNINFNKNFKHIIRKPFHYVIIDNFLDKSFINSIYKNFLIIKMIYGTSMPIIVKIRKH